jgi:hypothetical protein
MRPVPGWRGMKPYCDICRGERVVLMPVYPPVTFSHAKNSLGAVSKSISTRKLPCPQCVMVPEERLEVFSEMRAYDSYGDDPGFMSAVRRSMAHELVDQMIEAGFFRFKQSATDPITAKFKIELSVGFVHPDRVTSLEKRVRANQEVVAAMVVAEARKTIARWDSFFTGLEGGIRKSIAMDAVTDAFQNVRSKLPEPT